MLEFIRQSRSEQFPPLSSLKKANDHLEMSTSRHFSFRSSIEDGPSKASSVVDAGKSASSPQSRTSASTHGSARHAPPATPIKVPPKLLSSARAVPSGSLQSSVHNSVPSTQAHPSSPRFSQASSAISKASPSLVAAHGEFHPPGSTTVGNKDHGCVAQMDVEAGPRGSKNPHGLSLDQSSGYFPKGVPGTSGQNHSTQLSDCPSLEDLLRAIAAERLHYMPQKGSNWDRSIRALEGFALKVSSYASRHNAVVGTAQLKASMIYRECYVMLQHVRSHATSLVPALGMLADVSRTLSLLAGCPQQPTSSQIQQYLGQILDRTLDLMICMTSYFQDLSVGSSTVAGPSEFRTSLGMPLEVFDHEADQLLDEVWNYYIPSDTREPLVHFRQIQRLLQPQDEVVRKTDILLLSGGESRHEFTCEWFSEPFLDFVRGSDSAFWINGRVGCGKSVLCGWILESLQSAVDGQEYTTVTYAINSVLPSETKTICVIKALLLQIIRCQYRSFRLYEALANLISTSATGDAPIQFEKALWDSLEVAISEIEQPTMLVIDGLSEVDGGETAAAAFFQNLLRLVAGNPLARLLVLSRPFPLSPRTPLRRRTIEARDLHKDMCRVITALVPSHSPMPAVEIARRIDHEANGNFFWSLLAFQEWAAQNFSQQVWRTLPVSLEANAVSRLDFSDPVTCLVLFDSIIAIRPLRLVEIEVISRLDLNNRLLKPQAPNVLRAVEEACGSVLIVQEGIVLFRHAVLKQALFDMLQVGNLLLGPELHANIACRLLLYIKLILGQRSSLTLKPTPSLALEDLFHAHPLLLYALSYWPKHAIASSMFSEPEDCRPNSVCLTVFPDTVHAATVEASFWRRDLSIESIRALQLAALMRKEILGDHDATLQTFACLAEALRCRQDFTSAANYFYKAAEIAQQALPEFHSFTATCMLKYLEVIEAADDGNITDLLSRKADVLRYMISMYDTQTGPSSDQALKFSNLLASHYAIMQEYNLSTALSQHIHSLTMDRYGKDSSQAKVSAERLAEFLQYQSEKGAGSYDEAVNDDILQTYHVTDPRRIKALIERADDYNSLEEPFKAELIYVSLWHGVAESCSRHRNPENHEKLLQCGVTYAAFLRKHGRIVDSQNVLLALWGQQQALGYGSANISTLLVEVATEMRDSDLQNLALDVSHAALASSGIQDPDRIKKSISDITLDMVRDAQSNTTSEVKLRRVMEAKKPQGLTPADVPTLNALITQITDGNRFDDAVAIATEALHQLWPSVMDDSFDQTLCDSGPWVSELVQLATSLGNAYKENNQMDGAGRLYWRLFQVARKADAVDDSTTVEYANSALAAFEKTGQISRIIALREDLLDLCVMRFGDRHSNTIDARYALASLYLQEQIFDKAKQQYFHIADPSRQPGSHELAALSALTGLIDVCSRQEFWDQAVAAYASLWTTFLTKGRDYGFDPSTSKALYGEYTTLLKKQDPADIVRTHGLTEQYRSACTALWGERNLITMEAVLWLAEIESRLHPESIKAIRLYESLVDGEEEIPPEQREDAKAILEASESRLTDFYQASINDDGQDTAKGVHLKENIARAVRLQRKKYDREKTRRGASHPATLSDLAIWISMLAKQNRSMAIQESQLAINFVMESDDSPGSLYDAAVILADSFSANSFIEEGFNTVRGLVEHVIFEERARRSNLVFLAAFEAHLTHSVAGFTEVHAKLLRMSALWDYYRHASQASTDPGLTFACGARLREFLMMYSYTDRAILIEGDLYERFMEYYGAAFGQGIQTARELFFVLLEELSNEKLQFESPNMPSLAFTALTNNARSLVGDGQYTTALNVLIPGYELLLFVGAFAECSISVFEDGLWLGLMLAVPVDDQDTRTRMLNLSMKILQETLRQCRSQNFDFTVLSVDRISHVASVLGLQHNYEDLEWLLTRLWLSRKNLTSLQQNVIVRIGRRLVEVRYFHGHIDPAIELGEDILYNVQRVYGTSHPLTVDIARVLSTMYETTGDHSAAKAVIGNSQSALPDMKGYTAKQPNIEHVRQLYNHNLDTGDVPMVLQAPKDWGFLDEDEEQGFGSLERGNLAEDGTIP